MMMGGNVGARRRIDVDPMDFSYGAEVRATRALLTERSTTVVQIKHKRCTAPAATSGRGRPARGAVLAIIAAVVLGAFSIIGTAVGDNSPQPVRTDIAPMSNGDVERNTGVAMNPVRGTSIDYDPRNTELLLALGVTSAITNSNELTAEAMQVQAELDAAEAARIAEEKRLAAEAEARRIYAASGAIMDDTALALLQRLGIRRGQYIVPVVGATMSSGYGMRIDPVYGYEAFHSGMDFAVKCGTPIVASFAGVVTYAGRYGQLGEYVEISHGDISTGYGHMYEKSIMVSVGQEVSQGEVIGLVGNTGKSTGCHVHWQGISAAQGSFNPALFLYGLS